MAGRARREWGTGSVYETKRGYWRVSVPIPSDGLGRRRQEWQYRTEAAARRQLETVQRRLARGLPAEEGRLTVAEYAVEWLAQLQVKPSTKAMYGNPAHLFEGTRLDNERDKTAKGRRNTRRKAA